MKIFISFMSCCVVFSLFGADTEFELQPLSTVKEGFADEASGHVRLKLSFGGKIFELGGSSTSRFDFIGTLPADAQAEAGANEIQMPVGTTFDVMQKIIRKPFPDAREPLDLFSTEMILRDYLGDQTIHTLRDDMIEQYVKKVQSGTDHTEPNMESDFGKKVKQRLVEEMGVHYPFNCALPLMSLKIAHDKVLACSPHARYLVIEKNGRMCVVETSSKEVVHGRDSYAPNLQGVLQAQQLIYFSDDDSHLITHGSQPSDFVVVDLEKRIQRQSTIPGHYITSCALSPSKNSIAVGTHHSFIFLFEHGSLRYMQDTNDAIRLLPMSVIRFNQSGRYLLGGSSRICMWDLEKKTGKIIKDCGGPVTALVLSPDEKELKFSSVNAPCNAYTVDFPGCVKIEEHKSSDPIGRPDIFYGITGLPLLISTRNIDYESYKWACDKDAVYKVVNLRTGSQSSKSIGALCLKFSNGKFLKNNATTGIVHVYDLEFSPERKQLLMQLPCTVMRMMADISKLQNQLLGGVKFAIDQESLATSIQAVDDLSKKEQSKDAQRLLSIISAHLKRAQK